MTAFNLSPAATQTLAAAGTLGFCWLLLIITLPLTPTYTRRDEFFGVSIPPARLTDPYFTRARRSYIRRTIVLGILLAALSTTIVAALGGRPIAVAPGLALVFIYLAATFIDYLRVHRATQAYKQTQTWQPDTRISAEIKSESLSSQPGRIPHQPAPAWLLAYLLVIAATIVLTCVAYPHAPARIPLHIDLAGTVDRWVPKSPTVAAFMPASQTFCALIFVGVFFMGRHVKAELLPGDLEASNRDQRGRTAWLLRMLLWLGSLVLVLLSVAQAGMLGVVPRGVESATILLFCVVVFGGVAFAIVRFRNKVLRPDSQDRAGDSANRYRDDDRYWKAGVFYHNPDDPALFVEKRFGLGWTANYARPATWLIIAAFTALTATFILTLVHLGQ